MLLRSEHLRVAADNLELAVEWLRPYGAAGVNYEVGTLGDQLPEIRAWLSGLCRDDGWAKGFYNSDVEFVLALALALPQDGEPDTGGGEPDNGGVERGDDGWYVAGGAPVVLFGDAHFDAGLTLEGPLVVLGDLTVDGLLQDGDVDQSLLAVTGDLRARALHSGAFNLVLGDIAADVIVCFNSDGGLGAGGDIVADLFVQGQHSYELGGDLRVRVPILDWLPDGTVLAQEGTAEERLEPWLPAGHTIWQLLTEAGEGRSPVLAHRD